MSAREEEHPAADAVLLRDNRERCWKARDKLLRCMQSSKGTDVPACQLETKELGKACPPSWALYFLEEIHQTLSREAASKKGKKKMRPEGPRSPN